MFGYSKNGAATALVTGGGRAANGHRPPDMLPPVSQRIFDFDGWTRLLEFGTRDEWEAAYAEPAAEMVAGRDHWTAGDALVLAAR
jgi:hypothetical protein